MRIKLTFPPTKIFSTKINVHIADINYGGHMGNDRFLTVMQETRLRWLQAIGFPNERDIAPPIGLIVVDSAIQYKAEVFHAELLIEMAIDGLTEKSFDLYYNILKADGTIAAVGKTGVVVFDYKSRKVSPIPGSLKNKLEVYQ